MESCLAGMAFQSDLLSEAKAAPAFQRGPCLVDISAVITCLRAITPLWGRHLTIYYIIIKFGHVYTA